MEKKYRKTTKEAGRLFLGGRNRPSGLSLVVNDDDDNDDDDNLTNSMAYEPGGSMPHSQRLPNNPYPEPNQPNYRHWYLCLQDSF